MIIGLIKTINIQV